MKHYRLYRFIVEKRASHVPSLIHRRAPVDVAFTRFASQHNRETERSKATHGAQGTRRLFEVDKGI